MELQLGLALSSPPPAPPPIKGFDLNNFVDEARVCSSINDKYKKRSFAQAFDDGEHDKIGSTTSATAVPRTLPLLLWNSEPNEEDDNNPNKRKHTNSRFTVVIENDGDGLVGWPPIKSWRKEICFHHHHNNHCGGNLTTGNINGCGGGGGRSGSSSNSNQYYYNSKFVKVKMEGVGIARKIDLSLHQSFQTLTDSLMDMFDKCQMDSNNYKLTYQDRDGDWLLAQDVPWRSFIRSVQRLKLVKRNNKLI
ncbi:unnamed protein product [Malus baccata var. baccata]